VDHIDEALGAGWSVFVYATYEHLDAAEVARPADGVALEPWAAAREITGSDFVLAPSLGVRLSPRRDNGVLVLILARDRNLFEEQVDRRRNGNGHQRTDETKQGAADQRRDNREPW
jgi:hypothetical protein